MRKGPGWIERELAAIFDGEPDNAFMLEELCERAYPGVNRIEKKHRVAVARAAKNLAKRRTNLSWLHGDAVGGTLVFFTWDNVMSYGVARLKCDSRYSGKNDPRHAWHWTEAEVRAELSPGGAHYGHVVEGGEWWRYVHRLIAERDGEHELVAPAVQSLAEYEGAYAEKGGWHGGSKAWKHGWKRRGPPPWAPTWGYRRKRRW
jgi:hypothetical protein